MNFHYYIEVDYYDDDDLKLKFFVVDRHKHFQLFVKINPYYYYYLSIDIDLFHDANDFDDCNYSYYCIDDDDDHKS